MIKYKYTTLFFDLDDTLVDTIQNNKEALLDIYEEYELRKYYSSYDIFYNKFRAINSDLWEQYANGNISKDYLKENRFMKTFEGIIKLTPDESMQMNDYFLDKVNTKKNVIPGGKEVLEYLFPKYDMYILSNGFQEVQSHKMNNAKLNPYFKKVILSDHIGKNKPHPAIFNFALEEAKAKHSEVIMIGDNLDTDITGAKNSGIAQIWFNPHNHPDTNNIAPTYTITNLNQLKDIL